jgi:ribosomal protein S18 acetylase RimI-like enzyme
VTAAEARAIAADLVEVYRLAFGAAPYFESEESIARFGAESLPRHLDRAGFRCAVAREGGGVVGFGYGYTGAPGQWWHDWVLEQLDAATATEWARSPFEVVELAVVPAAQGRGTGARLHDALLVGLPHRTALLSTRDADTPALRLYVRQGWVTLRAGIGAGCGHPGVRLMGLRLP